MCHITARPDTSSTDVVPRRKKGPAKDSFSEGGEALRRHVLLKAAAKVVQEPCVSVKAGVSPACNEQLVIQRTVVIDLDLLCCGIKLHNAGKATQHIWLRPFVRPFLETLKPLFRLAVWSRNGAAWVDAALDALDPQHELLPRRAQHTVIGAPEQTNSQHAEQGLPSLSSPSSQADVGTTGEAIIVDDGHAVHPADVIIVAPDRTAFGTMSQNVIEVERFAAATAVGRQGDGLGGADGADDALMQLASVLVRNLASPPPPEDPWEAAAAAVAAWDGPQPLPPVAVELRRLGLLNVHIRSSARPETTSDTAAAASAAPHHSGATAATCSRIASSSYGGGAESGGSGGGVAGRHEGTLFRLCQQLPAQALAHGPTNAAEASRIAGVVMQATAAVGEWPPQRRPRHSLNRIPQQQHGASGSALDVLSLARLGHGGGGDPSAAPPSTSRRSSRRPGAQGLDKAALRQLKRMPASEIASAAVQLAEAMEARMRQHRQHQATAESRRQGAAAGRQRREQAPRAAEPRPARVAEPPLAPAVTAAPAEAVAAVPDEGVQPQCGGGSQAGSVEPVSAPSASGNAALVGMPASLRRSVMSVVDGPADAPPRRSKARPALASCFSFPCVSEPRSSSGGAEVGPLQAGAAGHSAGLHEGAASSQSQGAVLAWLAAAVRRSFRKRMPSGGCADGDAVAPVPCAARPEEWTAGGSGATALLSVPVLAEAVAGDVEAASCYRRPECELAQPEEASEALRATPPADGLSVQDRESTDAIREATAAAAVALPASGGGEASMELLVMGGSLHAPRSSRPSCSRIASMCTLPAGRGLDSNSGHGSQHDTDAAVEIADVPFAAEADACIKWADVGLELDRAPLPPRVCSPSYDGCWRPQRYLGTVCLSEPGCPPRAASKPVAPQVHAALSQKQ